MYGVSLTTDIPDVLDAIEQDAKSSPKRVQRDFDRRVIKVKQYAIPKLQKRPGPPKYPLRWKSQKQRRYVMAKLREENKLPYPRTYRTIADWELEFTPKRGGITGEVELKNDNPVARYLQGDDMQPYHIDTGWEPAAPVAAEARRMLENELIDVWGKVALP